jgi:AAA+ ATPase superfamily predicted ATPase
LLLQQFSQRVWQHGHPGERAPRTFSYGDWSEALEELAQMCQFAARPGERRHIIIIDEFPYAATSEPALPSILQNAWDHHLKFSNVCMVLCGSHVGMMESLVNADAPLYGRMIGPLRVGPLPFSATAAFYPSYSVEQRVAVYAILGGVPAYLELFSDTLSLGENIKQNLFRETGLFRSDPNALIGEQVRDPTNYRAVLTAIAEGSRHPADIALAAGLSHRSSAGPYLARLVEMDYVRCELPVTVPPKQRPASRLGRYVLADNYLRFYFRFVQPNFDLLAQGLHNQVERRITEQLRAFIGMTTFEELCQEWVLTQARAERLPLAVEQVGAHWGNAVQVDVAAINWRDKALLLGEAKWGMDGVGRSVIRELIEEKTPKVLASLPHSGADWSVHYVFFARRGFTAAAQALAAEHGARLVDLATLDRDLTE